MVFQHERRVPGPSRLGKLSNVGDETHALDGVLQVALLAADGERLTAPAAPAGIALPESDLRELHSDALWEVQNRAAYELVDEPIAPGSSRDFQALFREVPEGAARFAVEPAPKSFEEAESRTEPMEADRPSPLSGSDAPTSAAPSTAVPVAPDSASPPASPLDAAELTWDG